MENPIFYENPLFSSRLKFCYERLEFRKIPMGVADKLLFKDVAIQEVKRLLHDKNMPQNDALLDGLGFAMKIFADSYLPKSKRR